MMEQLDNQVEELPRIDIITIILDFLRTLGKMWPTIFGTAILVAALFGAYKYVTYQPYYTASATFTINIKADVQDATNSSTAYFDNATAEQMAITFPYILTSDVLQKKVANELQLSYVPGRIGATVISNTNLLTISVRDIDPNRAYYTLQAVINNYPSVSEVIIGKVNMNMLDQTGIPSKVDNPRTIAHDVTKGAGIGVVLGVIWVAITSLRRRTIRREEDCPKYINLKCLGAVPYIPQKQRSGGVKKQLNVMDEKVNGDFKEAFRIIRNKVQRSARENDLKTILITSTLAGEGKSTASVNLAISLAQEGKRIAIMDCDLRNPSDAEILGVKAGVGLVDYMRGRVSIEDCIYTAEQLNLVENLPLMYIPVGTAVADGSNLLGTEKMKKAIETISKQVDYLLLDCAPVGILTDASVLAQYADGAVYIVKKDYARSDHILNGIEHLSEGNIHIIGCVLNGD